MKKLAVFVCVVLAAAFVAGCSGTKKGEVLVNVNGTKITEGDLDFLGTINPRIMAQIQNPEGKKRLLDNLVEQELLYQEAVKEGIGRKADVKAKIDLYRRVIIAQSLVDDEIEKAAKKYYDEHTDEFQKLKLADIMVKYTNPEDMKKAKTSKSKEAVRSETDALKLANEIKARLDKGEDFATVAKEVSEDAATKARGGDMGSIAKGDKRLEARGMGPLADKAFEMKVGEIAGPIKTNQGYFIITVTQGLEVEPFEEAKTALIFKLRNDARTALLAKLKKDSKIKYAGEEKAVAEKKEEGKPSEAIEGQAPAPEGQAVTVAPAQQPEKAAPQKAPAVKMPEVKTPDVKKLAKETEQKATEKPAPAVKKQVQQNQ